MNFAIMAGGTGGHIFPGIAVAKALQKRGHKIFWLGAKGGMEERIVKQHGIVLTLLSIKPLRGKGVVGMLMMPFRLTKGIWQARQFFKKNQIDAAISMGGYVAAPGGFATKLCSTVLIVHEQNSVFGLTNKSLAKMAQLVLTGFDLNQQFNSRWVGNPVRETIEQVVKSYDRKTPINVLIMGGSLGAQALNSNMPVFLHDWLQQGVIKIKHQCGRDKYRLTEAAYGEYAQDVDLQEFIHNMAAVYQWADVCICRAGALTIAEISAVGIQTLFVPFPHAVDDHQTQNALSLVNKKAALIWQEKESAESFKQKFSELIDVNNRSEMQQVLKAMRKVNVADSIAELCEQVVS
jgi:UDP-N-acetylglucosamine--N-acetylmuramyl-(pentapeptide) pyrophosphoryl-undecaprenol N-acetylglucosamine transferase